MDAQEEHKDFETELSIDGQTLDVELDLVPCISLWEVGQDKDEEKFRGIGRSATLKKEGRKAQVLAEREREREREEETRRERDRDRDRERKKERKKER